MSAVGGNFNRSVAVSCILCRRAEVVLSQVVLFVSISLTGVYVPSWGVLGVYESALTGSKDRSRRREPFVAPLFSALSEAVTWIPWALPGLRGNNVQFEGVNPADTRVIAWWFL